MLASWACTWMRYCSHKKLVGDLDDLPQHKDCHSRSTWINTCRKHEWAADVVMFNGDNSAFISSLSTITPNFNQFLTRHHLAMKPLHDHSLTINRISSPTTPWKSAWAFEKVTLCWALNLWFIATFHNLTHHQPTPHKIVVTSPRSHSATRPS